MKKNLFVIMLLLSNFCFGKSYGEVFTKDTILNNSNITFKQIQKADWEQKYKVMRYDFGLFTSPNSVDWQLYAISNIPPEQRTDKDSLSSLIEMVKDKNSYNWLIDKLSQDFNIYYEANIHKDANLYNFYKDLKTNKGIPNIKSLTFEEKKAMLENYLFPINNVCFFYEITDNYVNQAFELLELYFALDEFQEFKAPNRRYHIYKLGHGILFRLNDYSYPFIKKKLLDKNTNLENLAYFLEKVDFNMYMPPEGEKEFDNGEFNPKIGILPSEYYLSQIMGDSNKIAKYFESKGLICTPVQRIVALHINTNYDEAVKIIDKSIKDNNLTSNEKIITALTALIKNDQKERAELEEYIKNNWLYIILNQ